MAMERFADLVAADLEEPAFGRLRAAEPTGRPLGTAEFVADLERRPGRPVARAPGRKPGVQTATGRPSIQVYRPASGTVFGQPSFNQLGLDLGAGFTASDAEILIGIEAGILGVARRVFRVALVEQHPIVRLADSRRP